MDIPNDLELNLAGAAEAARHALKRVEPERAAFIDVLHRFDVAVESANVEVPSKASEGIREATEAFQTRYDVLRSTLEGLAERTAANLSEAFVNIERDCDLVTIMLFGRSRAGKSTTMEALTGGDGASIGIGKQNTTTVVRAYYFPRSLNGTAPDGPALRIVDAPGIEAFQGEALAEMAEEFVERSDHIFFLLSDDKATADELDHFGVIGTQGKGITVLLNVKAKDEDLDLLMSRPELIFKPEEIDGHSRRICGYLKNHFDMPQPCLIPLHARAAWLGRRDAELPDGLESRELLVWRSGLLNVEDRISAFIRNEALPARLCAPRDLLLSYLWPLKSELRPFAGEFRQMMVDIDQLARRLEIGTERARARVASRFPLLRSRFQAANDAIPGMVDSVITASGRGAALNSQWQQLLRVHGVADATAWFVTAGQRDFEAELAEEVRATSFDYQFANADDLDGLLGKYHEAEESAKRNKYARAGIRTAGGVGAATLATWAIANWWNPTGWAAAAAAALIAGAGLVGESAARKAADEWERSSKMEMHVKRVEIIAKLRERIWSDFRGVRAGCGAWLDETKALHLQVAHEVARPIQKSARLLWQATVACLSHLDEVAYRINAGLVSDIFWATVPECADGAVQVGAVARSAGYRTKVMVSAAPGSRASALASCIGRQGLRIRQISNALGGDPIDLVDGNAPPKMQILQALGQSKSESAIVNLDEREGQTTAFVRFETSSQSRAAVGPRGANIRLASQLMEIKIIIEGCES